MNKRIRNLLYLSTLLLISIPESANALPGFARQTGQSCTTCHTQNMPKLNSYGRHFALTGYTLYDKESEIQSLIEGTDVALGLPAVLNISAVLKAQYAYSSLQQRADNGDPIAEERGELQVLEGSGLYFGGRFADNVGGIVSLTGDPSEDRDVVFSGKGVLAYPTFDGFSGLALYSTQINGIFSGMENYNTGLYAPLKQFESPNTTNAAQATGIGRGPATGVQAYYGDERFFGTIGLTIPSQNSEGIDAAASLIPFGRLAYNQPIGEWNLMVGLYGLSGDVEASDQSLDGLIIDSKANIVKVHKEGYGLDVEATGEIGGMTTMTTVNLVIKNVVDITLVGALTTPSLQQTDNQAASIEFQINPIAPLGVKVAYLNYNNINTADTQEFIKAYDFDAYSFGVNYLFRQNIIVDFQYSYNHPTETVEYYHDIYVSAVLAF